MSITDSILHEKALERGIGDIYSAPVNAQISLFKDTLQDLEDYFDTGDLTELNTHSLGVIKQDILDIIKGFKKIESGKSEDIFSSVSSIDKILDKLRQVKIRIFAAEIMLRLNIFLTPERDDFFGKFSECQKLLEEALEAFL